LFNSSEEDNDEVLKDEDFKEIHLRIKEKNLQKTISNSFFYLIFFNLIYKN